MKPPDKVVEHLVRRLARSTSRRGFLGRLSMALVGSSFPLLPLARASGQETYPGPRQEPPPKGYPGVAPQPSLSPDETGDPTSCDYWRYCGIGGTLCACCGGSANACPPGSEMSPLGWIGTCINPVDGKYYVISYNDCCGKPLCNRCACNRSLRNPKNTTPARPQSSGQINWCLGMKETFPTCSTANVLGISLEQE
jgi:methylamine dehydrogenase light chain